MQVQSAAMSAVTKVPGVLGLLDRAGEALVKGSSGGPDADRRAHIHSYVIGAAYDAGGRKLAEVRLKGVDGYTFTAGFLAWAAQQVLDRGFAGTGALGPVDAFGLAALEQGVAEAGIVRARG
jgi:hypothetical protein